MADIEAKIGEKVVGENTKITFTVRVAFWIIGGLIFLFTTAFTVMYVDVKGDVKAYKEQSDKDKSDFIKTVEAKLDEKLGTFQDKDEEFIKEMGDMRGDIKVILDRTSGLRPSENTINKLNTPPGK